MATNEKKTTTTAGKKVSTTPRAVATEPRNFLVAFLFTMLAGPLGLRHFYLGDRKLGWVRTAMFAGGYVWFFILAVAGQAALAGLGLLAVTVAAVWALIDFFYVYNSVKVDASGQLLVATERDRRWARYLYLAVIIGFVASVVIGAVAASVIENAVRNSDWYQQRMQNDGWNSDTTETEVEQYLRQLQEQSQSDTQLN